MINTFCKLRIEGTDTTVAVNPRLVREVREAKTSKDACVIFFDENHSVTVTGKIKYVGLNGFAVGECTRHAVV